MPRLRNQDDSSESLNIFQAFTDLMSNAFIMVTFLLVVSFLLTQLYKDTSKEKTQNDIFKLKGELESAKFMLKKNEDELKSIEVILENKNHTITEKQKEIDKLNKIKMPKFVDPIIAADNLTKKFQFQSGSAQLNPEFKDTIKGKITDQIINSLEKQTIHFIQVIGHTDSQEVLENSNLDANLLSVANSRKSDLSELSPGSNIDLGLIRALAVVRELENSPRLRDKKLKFRAYSAGQLYDKDTGELTPISKPTNDEKQRRIEIRFVPPANKT